MATQLTMSRMPMRPANTVKVITRRLEQAEAGEVVDPMELVSIHDELARVERKWLEQFAAGSERRKPGRPRQGEGLVPAAMAVDRARSARCRPEQTGGRRACAKRC